MGIDKVAVCFPADLNLFPAMRVIIISGCLLNEARIVSWKAHHISATICIGREDRSLSADIHLSCQESLLGATKTH